VAILIANVASREVCGEVTLDTLTAVVCVTEGNSIAAVRRSEPIWRFRRCRRWSFAGLRGVLPQDGPTLGDGVC
jgi:hypothetical protein